MAARIEGTGTRSWAGPLITEEQRAEFDDRGFVLLEGALAPPLVDRLTQATERIWTEQLAKGLDHGASLQLKGFVTLDDAFLDLLDHPTTFPLVVGILGWNIFLYHCHLDVNPPARTASTSRWGWHRDGERIDLDLAMRPGPMMSVKVAFFLTDVSEADRG
ncbi:MAG: phytanoyl-CoA dioxygenase family protein, partial [Actinobacteria bacterium]|nr:phytanoyl-CoA dioxygenase family protein [Actinomycetota bacterium]